jgi:hypothetical protein
MRFLVLIFLPFSLLAQVSVPELKWSVLHPVAAIRTRSVKKECDFYLSQHPVLLSGPSIGGKQDAFRHLFYMSAIANKIGVRKARQLGRAHEKGNYRQWKHGQLEDKGVADSLACVMDLRNNDSALSYIQLNKNASISTLYAFSLMAVQEGKAWILLFNNEGQRLNCDLEIIHVTLPRKWYVAGCLVISTTR